MRIEARLPVARGRSGICTVASFRADELVQVPVLRCVPRRSHGTEVSPEGGRALMDVRFRPLTTWPGSRTSRRQRDRFDTSWSSTLDLLERELRHLGGTHIVIEIALKEDQIRLDGWPRADARPSDPGVVISFDSRYGPLRYATDVFFDWQANVRAVALGLEALRKVDRYGITRRGEQYKGWKQLPPGIALGPAGFDSREAAAEFLSKHSSFGSVKAPAATLIDNPERARLAYREAAKRLHPDAGGDTAEFQRLQAAWAMLEVAS